MNTHRSIFPRAYKRVLLALPCWALPPYAGAREDEIVAGGKIKYPQYCATCHGATGTGDGQMAALLVVKPANLTQLSKQNKGEFPFWRVYRAIDGRALVRGQGNREMPLWGFVFQVEEGANETSARAGKKNHQKGYGIRIAPLVDS